MGVTFIQKSQGGKLKYRFADTFSDGARWDASPAPTVTLYDSGGAELVASQSATLGPSTSLDAAAVAAQTTIPLTATTDVERGEQYVITNATGQWEWVTVEAITASVSVTARDNLLYTYASDDTFKSHTMSVSVSSSDITATYKNCYAKWDFTVDTVERQDYTTFHVSLYAPRLTVTPQDLTIWDANAMNKLGSNQRMEDYIREVWKRHVLPDVAQMFDPSCLISADALHLATIYKVLENLAAANRQEEERDEWRGLYGGRLEANIMQSPVDLDQSGGVEDEEKVRSVRSGRLLRG